MRKLKKERVEKRMSKNRNKREKKKREYLRRKERKQSPFSQVSEVINRSEVSVWLQRQAAETQ